MAKRVSEGKRDAILRDLMNGWPIKQIAEHHQVSTTTVWNIDAKHRAETLAKLREMEKTQGGD